MLIATLSTLAVLSLTLALLLQRRRARRLADPDGPRTLMPGMNA